MTELRLSEQSVDCFAHGLAHLMADLGFEGAVAVASKIVLGLTEDG